MANQLGTFIAHLNKIEDATITTDADAQGDRIATNLATRESDDVWRFAVSSGSTSATATATWDTDQTMQVFTCQFPRTTYPGVSESSPSFASTDTIRWVAKDSGGSTLYDSTATASDATAGYMVHWHEMDSELTTVRSLEVTFDAASREDAGFCDVGTIGAWPIIKPNVGFSYPGARSVRVNREQHRTTAGRLYTARFDPTRVWRLAFERLTSSEAMQLEELLRYSGGARQVFVHRGDLPAGKDAMHALVEARDFEGVNDSYESVSLTFEEFI